VYKNHKIIHRDLKPENILLDKNNIAYITDWGIYKDLTMGENTKNDYNLEKKNFKMKFTKAGSILGTISYISPEQIKGSKDIVFRSDIYSLGCLM